MAKRGTYRLCALQVHETNKKALRKQQNHQPPSPTSSCAQWEPLIRVNSSRMLDFSQRKALLDRRVHLPAIITITRAARSASAVERSEKKNSIHSSNNTRKISRSCKTHCFLALGNTLEFTDPKIMMNIHFVMQHLLGENISSFIVKIADSRFDISIKVPQHVDSFGNIHSFIFFTRLNNLKLRSIKSNYSTPMGSAGKVKTSI